jgi:ABC-type protease/lipase transport system fused ATPase/permease subunit
VNAIDRNLLIRVARRLEEQADQAWHTAAMKTDDVKALDAAKRRRDRELGDAKDLRDFVKRSTSTTEHREEPKA